jgi:hypothetical protein
VDEGHGNDRSDTTVTILGALNSQTRIDSINADNGIIGREDQEGSHEDYDDNQAPSSLEYSDGEGGKGKGRVTSEMDDEEEVDELNSSKYEGLSMAGMMVNADSGGYYEKGTDDMDMADDTAQMNMDDGMVEAAMDVELLEEAMEPMGAETVEDEIPMEMEVDGETCLFSRAAIAELHLLRENVHLRGEEMDEELGEFLEEQEYGDLISTVVVQAAPVAGPSQPQRGRTGGNSKC